MADYPGPAVNGPRRLRELLAADSPVLAPGVYDALGARLVEEAGFEAVYMTGFGTAASLLEAAQEFEGAGVAGVHLEDQVAPKKCGHMEGRQVIPTDEMLTKIRAATAARQSADFVIIARTDARAVEGLPAALDRARRYCEAGADVLFVEAATSAGSSASSSRKVAPSPASQAAKNAVTPGIRRRSTSAFRARQLGKPWSRATASWASANLARGSARRSSTRTSFARFLRWSSEGRCGSSDFDMATRPSVEWPGVRGSRAGSQGWLSVQSVG
jgi:isocitrate lyase